MEVAFAFGILQGSDISTARDQATGHGRPNVCVFQKEKPTWQHILTQQPHWVSRMRTEVSHFDSKTCKAYKREKLEGQLRAGGVLTTVVHKHQEAAHEHTSLSLTLDWECSPLLVQGEMKLSLLPQTSKAIIFNSTYLVLLELYLPNIVRNKWDTHSYEIYYSIFPLSCYCVFIVLLIKYLQLVSVNCTI